MPEEIDVYGGPGTGKTSYLIAHARDQIQSGINPNRIAFISHTRAAVDEAKGRAMREQDFGELEFWRTAHSLAYKTLGLDRDNVVSLKDLKEFERIIGEPIVYHEEQAALPGRKMLEMYNYERSLMGKVSRLRTFIEVRII